MRSARPAPLQQHTAGGRADCGAPSARPSPTTCPRQQNARQQRARRRGSRGRRDGRGGAAALVTGSLAVLARVAVGGMDTAGCRRRRVTVGEWPPGWEADGHIRVGDRTPLGAGWACASSPHDTQRIGTGRCSSTQRYSRPPPPPPILSLGPPQGQSLPLPTPSPSTIRRAS